MSEVIGNWVEKAKSANNNAPQSSGVKVVRREQKSKGNLIMEIAEMLRPWLMKKVEGVRDKDGLLVQPACVRAVALNVAQDIVNKYQD